MSVGHMVSSCFQLNQPAGASLLQLTVKDPDSPRNGPPFEFRIAAGNEGNYFSLDRSGTLRTTRVLGPQARREFTLEIQVRR